jgi:predicted phage tail protein
MSAGLREVRLYGRLGDQFGRVFHLAVQSPSEAARALCAVIPGFRQAFLGADGQAAYHVYVGRGKGRSPISVEQKDDLVPASSPIRIVPVVAGAKRGFGQAILGAVLMVAGVALGVVGALTPGGQALFYVGQAVFSVGAAMVVGGVVQMLSPQRKADNSAKDGDPSYGMDAGAVNTSEAGVPVPLAYGRVIAGAARISGGLATDEIPIGSGGGSIPSESLPDYMDRDVVDSGAVGGDLGWGNRGS